MSDTMISAGEAFCRALDPNTEQLREVDETLRALNTRRLALIKERLALGAAWLFERYPNLDRWIVNGTYEYDDEGGNYFTWNHECADLWLKEDADEDEEEIQWLIFELLDVIDPEELDHPESLVAARGKDVKWS